MSYLRFNDILVHPLYSPVMKRSSDLLPVTFPRYQPGLEETMDMRMHTPATTSTDDTHLNRRLTTASHPVIRRSQSLGEEKDWGIAPNTSISTTSSSSTSSHTPRASPTNPTMSPEPSPTPRPARHTPRSRSHDLISDDSSESDVMFYDTRKKRRIRVDGPRGEKLVEHRVMIRGGKYRESAGVIRASAHGFYTIELADGKGTILKRLHDLGKNIASPNSVAWHCKSR